MGTLLNVLVGVGQRVFSKKKGKRKLKGAEAVTESLLSIREPGESLVSAEVILAHMVRLVVVLFVTVLFAWVAKLMGVPVDELLEIARNILLLEL